MIKLEQKITHISLGRINTEGGLQHYGYPCLLLVYFLFLFSIFLYSYTIITRHFQKLVADSVRAKGHFYDQTRIPMLHTSRYFTNILVSQIQLMAGSE